MNLPKLVGADDQVKTPLGKTKHIVILNNLATTAPFESTDEISD